MTAWSHRSKDGVKPEGPLDGPTKRRIDRRNRNLTGMRVLNNGGSRRRLKRPIWPAEENRRTKNDLRPKPLRLVCSYAYVRRVRRKSCIGLVEKENGDNTRFHVSVSQSSLREVMPSVRH